MEKFPTGQRNNYLSAIQSLKDELGFDPKKYQANPKIDEKLCFLDHISKVKARNITAQSDAGKVLFGYFTHLISQMAKKNLKCYGSGLNTTQISARINKYKTINGQYRVFCVDGSAFDSTQHKSIYETVNVPIYLHFLPRLQHLLPDFIPLPFLEAIIRETTQTVILKDNSGEVYIKYVIYGTQATGKMDTTLGNTLRNIVYIIFIGTRAGLTYNLVRKDFFFLAAGDDTWIMLKTIHLGPFKSAALNYVYHHEPDKEVIFGLGQVARLFDISKEVNGTEFCSNIILENVQGGIGMVRKIDRVLQLVSWTMNNPKGKDGAITLLNKELAWQEGMNLRFTGVKVYDALSNMLLRLGQRPGTTNSNHLDAEARERAHSIQLGNENTNCLDSAFREHYFKTHGIFPEQWDVLIEQMNAALDIYEIIHSDLIDLLHKGGKPTNNWYVADQVDIVTMNKNGVVEFESNPLDTRFFDTIYHTC